VPTPTNLPYSDYPRRKTPKAGLKHWLAGIALRMGGWTMGENPPALRKLVVVAAPHTSWWDGIWMVTAAWWWDLPLSWFVKDNVAPKGFRWLFRLVGAILVNRSSPQGLVEQMAEEFRKHDELVLAVPPEGTRKKGQYWKSGFYYIAKEAKVPVCYALLDYGKRFISFGPCFEPTGNVKSDMDIAREFYREAKGLYEEKFTPPLMREEEA
jgi:1-acyl-sn-glycerol-3-phosphate acyltransferase